MFQWRTGIYQDEAERDYYSIDFYQIALYFIRLFRSFYYIVIFMSSAYHDLPAICILPIYIDFL